MNRNNHGFTLLEMVIVLVLISIISATVFTRSITTEQMNISAQTEKIMSHIRYAHSMAMKRNENWGIFCLGATYCGEYWLFGPWSSIGDELNPVRMPGQDAEKISLLDLKLDIPTPFVLIFDGHGKPSRLPEGPLVGSLEIIIENFPDQSQSQKFYITAETGLITNQ